MPLHIDQPSAVFCTEEQNPNVTDRFFQFRKSLFIDALRWDLKELEGREKDQFDTATTVYCILHRKGRVIAGFRGVRTDRPYLAQTVFPQLATLAPYPQRHDVWEISRFGVTPAESGSPTARILYSLMFHFARRCHATALVALADLRYERFLTRLGIRTRRYGPPQSIGLDETGQPLMLVAGDIPIANQHGWRFEALVNLADEMEIDDETLVLGSERLSA
jgi:acyl homoserine lactone synthase